MRCCGAPVNLAPDGDPKYEAPKSYRRELAERDAVLAVADGVIDRFLKCPEIADCAPDDKDGDTHTLEGEARKFRANLPASARAVMDVVEAANILDHQSVNTVAWNEARFGLASKLEKLRAAKLNGKDGE